MKLYSLSIWIVLWNYLSPLFFTDGICPVSASVDTYNDDYNSDASCTELLHEAGGDMKLHDFQNDILHYDNGVVYSGGTVNGLPEGNGREETPAGHLYDGEWEGGVKSGAGKYTWNDGRIYKGEFRNNRPNGMGNLKTPDGASYIGMWVDGSKHGKGRYRWPNGRVYEGEWKHGLQHGFGKLFAPPSNAQSHIGTNGNIGTLIYEGKFHKGSPITDVVQ